MNHDELLRIIAQAAKDGVTSLDLSNKGLTELPPEIGKLTHLKNLNLINNHLTTLPPEIGNLGSLENLRLGQNRISQLPEEFRQLIQLKHLDLVSNQLTVFPHELTSLINLTNLFLSANRLITIPPDIKNLTKLRTLYLDSNQICTLPPEIGELKSVEYLILVANQLASLPDEITKLSKLKKLNVKGNPLPIPFEILATTDNSDQIILYYMQHRLSETSHVKALTRESISQEELCQFLREIAQDTTQTLLDLSNKGLTVIPPEIGELTHVTELNLSHNQLTALPKEIARLTKLIRLDLRYNHFTVFPEEICNLPNLTVLHLGANQITTLPPTIEHLKNLKRLKLWNNQLSSIPLWLCKLTNLRELSLLSNHLSTIPREIYELTNLQRLLLGDNPLPIPPEILKLSMEPAKILNYYFQHIEGQKKPLHEAKVLIVGQGAVGKTSLIKRLLEDKFDPHEIKTDGIAINHWHININDTQIQLNVWDFGGQEIMHATHQFFLTKRSLYLLVLDSRLDEKENRVEYWLKIVQSFGGDSPVIVVCNKNDEHDLELDWRGLQNKYPAIKAFAKKVSCKTGDGITELRELIGREAGQLEHIHDELILPWFAVKTQLEEMQRDYIAYSDYQKMCAAENIADDLSQQTLLGFLHDLGIVLHFHDHPILEDTNVLNPEWVTRGVYQILNSNELFQRKGELERTALDRILDPQAYPRHKHQFILDMMRKFELCFDFAEYAGQRFLVPDLLAKEEPYTGDWEGSLGFQYHYDILPGSVISRFMVRMHAYIYKKTYWRNGVVLISEDSHNKALVKADSEDKKIFISVTGKPETRHTFLAIIRADFRKIHATIPKLVVKEKVPVPGHLHVVVDYEHLLTLEELDEESFIPEGLREKVSVRELLHGIAGSAGVSPASSQTETFAPPFPSWEGLGVGSSEIRLNQQITELRQRWDWLSEKLSRLEREKILETRVDEKLRIENSIAELTAEREHVEQRLNELEAKPHSI